MRREPSATALVERLAVAHAGDAWRLALVAGADAAAAGRAAQHALVIGAVEGGVAAERAGVLALARRWARSSPGAGVTRHAAGPVEAAFWSLPEPERAALWCTDVLHLPAPEVERVVGPAAPRAAAVARGRIRRHVCRQRRAESAQTACGPVADVLGKVLAGHAPASKAAMVERHAAGCGGCATLLAALRNPAAAVATGLPAAPALVGPARTAWRDHVGARRRSSAIGSARAGRSHRPVAAVLAVITAGSLGAATSQLAAADEEPEPPGPVAAPVRWARQPVRPTTTTVRPQAVIPPLAGEAALAPGIAPHFTPDLAEVTPVAVVVPPPAPAVDPPGEAEAPAPFGEPPPATDRGMTLDLSLPLLVPLPVGIQVGPSCSSVTLGMLRISLPCRR